MRSCWSSARAFSGLLRNEEASKIVQREVNATSSANSRTTSPYKRTIGRFTAATSFELSEFEAVHQVSRVAFRAKRLVEQRPSPHRTQCRGAHPRDETLAVE